MIFFFYLINEITKIQYYKLQYFCVIKSLSKACDKVNKLQHNIM